MSIKVANNRVQTFISNNMADESCLPCLLPAMHSTAYYNAEKVFEGNFLTTQDCPVFNEKLLYFFYGKPSYVVSPNENHFHTDDILSPVCFIIDFNKLPVYKAFPFDTGAFENEIYEGFFPPKSKKDEYELLSDGKSIQNYVRLFFNTNEEYVTGKSKIDENLLTNVATQTLGKLLKAYGTTGFDGRANSIELICNTDFDITTAAMAVIVPKPVLQNEFFIEFHTLHPDIEILTYFAHIPIDPARHNESVYQIAMQYLQAKGWIDNE